MQLLSQLSYDDLKEMLSLSIWVCEIGKNITFGCPDLSFTYGIDQTKLIPEHKQAVEYLLNNEQKTAVIQFIDDLKNGLQVAVTVNVSTQRICVIFRGSDDRYDWMAMPKSYQVDMTGGVKVHSGFKGLLDTHEEALNRTIDNLLTRHPRFELFMTGHCLGGAVCTLFGYLSALRLRDSDTHVNVVSFASPCVGNYQFRLAYDALANLSTTRVTNARDHLTSLPVPNYCHVGKTVLSLHEGGRCVLYTDYSYPFWLFAIPYCLSVGNHTAAKYWRALLKAESELDVFLEESRLLSTSDSSIFN